MPTDYGAGIYLTGKDDLPPSWDMEVTNSGDIRTVSGTDELQKDLAVSTAVRLGPEVGSNITPIVLNRIKARVLDAFEDDPRVNSVIVLEVNEIENESNAVEIVAQANAAQDETIELIFEVDV